MPIELIEQKFKMECPELVSLARARARRTLSRSRNVDALIRRATSTTRVAILLVGEGMNLAHHDLLDEGCPSGRAMKKV